MVQSKWPDLVLVLGDLCAPDELDPRRVGQLRQRIGHIETGIECPQINNLKLLQYTETC